MAGFYEVAKGPADLYCVPRILSHNEKGDRKKKIWHERKRERDVDDAPLCRKSDGKMDGNGLLSKVGIYFNQGQIFGLESA